MSLVEKIQKVRLEFQSDVKSLSSKNGELDQIRIKYLSRKGSIANLFNQLGSIRKNERPKVGQELNKLKIY